jgi:hypothetical protein
MAMSMEGATFDNAIFEENSMMGDRDEYRFGFTRDRLNSDMNRFEPGLHHRDGDLSYYEGAVRGEGLKTPAERDTQRVIPFKMLIERETQAQPDMALIIFDVGDADHLPMLAVERGTGLHLSGMYDKYGANGFTDKHKRVSSGWFMDEALMIRFVDGMRVDADMTLFSRCDDDRS